ncbi:MAG: TonB-dependent receptor [Alphaproteobacteria bacterium]
MKRFWLGSAALPIILMMMTWPVLAQSEAGNVDGPVVEASTVEAGAPGDRAMERLVISATRRAAGVQDVSLSVSAITGDQLKDNQIVDLSRLQALVPGLQYAQSGSDARPAIRGTRTEQVINNADPSVAFFVDDVYRSRPGQALSAFVDANRVEVLRGPQGTLFGRNSFGGAINLITNRPEIGVFDGALDVTFTNFDGIRAEGFVNVPVTDGVAVRFSGFRDVRDGYVVNTFDESNSLKDNEDYLVRGQVGLERGAWRAVARLEYLDQAGNGDGDFGYRALGVPVDPQTGLVTARDGIIEPRIGEDPAGMSNGGRPDANFFPADPGPYVISRDTDLQKDLEQISFSAEMNYDIGRFASVTLIGSYTDYSETRIDDGNQTPEPGNIFGNTVTAETFTQEIRIASAGDGRFDWVVGGFFLQDTATDRFLFAVANVPEGGDGTTMPALTQVPGFSCCTEREDKNNAIAFFGDMTVDVTEIVRVLGGLRYTREDRSLSATNGVSGAETFDRLTWRAGIEADVAADTLLYFTVSTGFLSGGFNFINNPVVPQTFDEQRVIAYEVGSKSSFRGGDVVLNLAAYYNDYTNLLTQGFVVDEAAGGALLSFLQNGGAVEAWGIEAEAVFTLIDNLDVTAALAYNRSEFGDFIALAPSSVEAGGDFVAPDGSQAFQLDGLQVPLNPEFTGTLAATYRIDLGAAGTVLPGVTFFYSTDYRTADQPYFFAVQDDYTRTDLRLTWRSDDERFTVQGFVTNLENDAVLTRSVIFGGGLAVEDYAEPRIYGVRAGVRY